MTRQDLDGQGKAHPAERAARINGWLDWGVDAGADDPLNWRRHWKPPALTMDDWAA